MGHYLVRMGLVFFEVPAEEMKKKTEGGWERKREREWSIKTLFRKGSQGPFCPSSDLPIAHTLRFSCMHYHECKYHGRTAEISPRRCSVGSFGVSGKSWLQVVDVLICGLWLLRAVA